MFNFTIPDNLSIFFDNLCIYYGFFDFISLASFFFTWWYCRKMTGNSIDESHERVNDQRENVTDTEEELQKLPVNDNIVSNIKKMRQKVIVNEVKSKLSSDDLKMEKEMERKQLEKIFQLLQDHEEKFQVKSMEQLHDQLNLYKLST